VAKRRKDKQPPKDERVSLHPLEFEEAMKILLDTPKPDAEQDDGEEPASA
jgi:hypothetical protein